MSLCERQGLDLVEGNNSDVNFTAGRHQGDGDEKDISYIYILEVTFNSRYNVILYFFLFFKPEAKKIEFLPIFCIVFICDVTQGFKNFLVVYKYFFLPCLLVLNVLFDCGSCIWCFMIAKVFFVLSDLSLEQCLLWTDVNCVPSRRLARLGFPIVLLISSETESRYSTHTNPPVS